jgi:hypothetical protein
VLNRAGGPLQKRSRLLQALRAAGFGPVAIGVAVCERSASRWSEARCPQFKFSIM